MSTTIDTVASAGGRATNAAPSTTTLGSFARVFERAVGALAHEPAALRLETGDLDANAALALQADVYRHAERLELTSKLLDHGVGAVKTLLQTRV